MNIVYNSYCELVLRVVLQPRHFVVLNEWPNRELLRITVTEVKNVKMSNVKLEQKTIISVVSLFNKEIRPQPG